MEGLGAREKENVLQADFSIPMEIHYNSVAGASAWSTLPHVRTRSQNHLPVATRAKHRSLRQGISISYSTGFPLKGVDGQMSPRQE